MTSEQGHRAIQQQEALFANKMKSAAKPSGGKSSLIEHPDVHGSGAAKGEDLPVFLTILVYLK